jgi:hypothetical protein
MTEPVFITGIGNQKAVRAGKNMTFLPGLRFCQKKKPGCLAWLFDFLKYVII